MDTASRSKAVQRLRDGAKNYSMYNLLVQCRGGKFNLRTLAKIMYDDEGPHGRQLASCLIDDLRAKGIVEGNINFTNAELRVWDNVNNKWVFLIREDDVQPKKHNYPTTGAAQKRESASPSTAKLDLPVSKLLNDLRDALQMASDVVDELSTEIARQDGSAITKELHNLLAKYKEQTNDQ